MGPGFSKKKKQAKKLQEQFMKMQEDLQKMEFTGSAGNGLVSVTLNGEYQVLSIKIKPDCVDPEDVDGLELLIKAAFNEASKKAQEQSSQGMPDLGALGGGLPGLPGF